MARTKRKVNPISSVPAPEVPRGRIYRTGGYVRLSVEDSRRPDTDTIQAQKELVLDYIKAQPDMELFELYCDNGRTGTNFERPDFERLMEAVRSGKVDCIVVKDLSRFGRNYKETGNYLERIFPFLDVRFVAVNDNFDTLTAERSQNGYIVPLKNIINEVYSRDISRKCSSALATKQQNGEFIGSWAPYGYRKCADDRHRLEPDEETAPIVRMIFQWRCSGASYVQIVRRLNEQGIPSPSKLHYMKGEVKTERFATAAWHVAMVKKLLSSEVYIGHMVQGRNRNNLPAGKKMCGIPKSEWIIVRNTHEPIIDEETFQAVQKLAEERGAVQRERRGKFDHLGTIPNILKGLVFCADCKRPMIRYKNVSEGCGNRYYSYICATHAENPASCPNKYLHETELREILWDTLQRELTLAGDLEKLAQSHSRSAAALSREDAMKREAEAAQRSLDRAKLLHDSLFQNYADKLMTEREYTEMRAQYRADMEKAKARLAELECQRKAREHQVVKNPWLAACGQYRMETELTEDVAHALIQRVEVDADNRVSITLRCRDEYDALIRLLKEDGEAVPA